MQSAEFRGFRPKQPEELEAQLNQTQSILGENKEHSLLSPSIEKDDVFNLTLPEIKKKYARRYEMYLELLHNRKGKDPIDQDQERLEDMRKWLGALNALDKYIQNHNEGREVTLKDRQFTVFEDLRNFIEAGGTDGYVKLPTGVGKTVLFTELIEALNLRTLIVVPTRILVGQTEEKMETFAPDLDVKKIMGRKNQDAGQVTIITYDSFVSQIDGGKLNPADFDCLVLDEAHLALSKKRSETVRKFGDKLKLGFTATPDYSYEKKLNSLLPAEIHSMKIKEAVEEEGLLCGFSALIARTQIKLPEVNSVSGDYNEKQLARAVNVESRNKAAVRLYKEGFEGQLAIAYCVGVDHAEEVAKQFNEQGVVAAVISGRMSPRAQEGLLKQFDEGQIKVLCNADLLIAGFDEPKATVCLNLRPTRSRVVAEQRGGRVLRLNDQDSEKHAYIIDFIDQGLEDNQPVLFADVAEGAEFMPKKKKKVGGGGERPPVPILNIPDLEVIVDVEEVMRIVSSFQEEPQEQKRSEIYTEASALVKLETAFLKWQALPEDKRGKFNPYWLKNNGFGGLVQWSEKNISLIELVVKSSNQNLRDNFKKQEHSEAYTEASALTKLETAFLKWNTLPEENRKKFNISWLINNGFDTLYNWSRRNISLSDLIAKSNNQNLKDNFEKRDQSEAYTEASALKKLEVAFLQWQALPEEKRGKFNANWLNKNGYSGLVSWWFAKSISLEDVVVKSSNKDLQDAFAKKDKADISVPLKEMEAAFLKWKSMAEEERGKFNGNWLQTNGFSALRSWSKQNTSLIDLVAASNNAELQASFEKQIKSEPYTEAAILVKLEVAFLKWQAQPQDKRGKFNANWLKKNGFDGLFQWTQDNVRLDQLVAKSGNQELQDSFEKQAYTESSALKKIEAAFLKWKSLPQNERGKFNSSWLRRNGFDGVYQWTLTPNGTPLVDLVAKSNNEELQALFGKKD